jgi:hypothetical protein
MADNQSSGLFEVVFYCVALVAAGIWALRYLDLGW